jgi:CheY-like chemotaxis protein
MINLLVIDDEPVVRALVCHWGRAAGYAVAEAESVADAVVQIGAVAPAVALCDVHLPDGDGRELEALLRQHSPHTALVLMSGLGAGASRSCLASGAIGYLAKPFTRAQLVAAIEGGVDEHFDRLAGAQRESPADSAVTGYDVGVATLPMP